MLPTPEVPTLDEKVYEPAEDSYLLLDCFEERLEIHRLRRYPVVCEIGTGSGIVSAFLHSHIFPDGIFVATDINPAACATAKQTLLKNSDSTNLKADVCQMSLTSALRAQTVDILVFNPPYVPAEEVPDRPTTSEDPSWIDLALLGGPDGMIVTWDVLNGLDTILAPGGAAYILFCARNKPDEVAATMRARGWKVETVAHRKAGWEVLSVLEFVRGE